VKQALEIILGFAKRREEQTVLQLKRLSAELHKSQSFNDQVVSYIHEYEGQMVEAAKKGTSVAYLQDSTSFRNRLHAGAIEQGQKIAGLDQASNQAKGLAVEAKLRVQGIEKVLARKHQELLALRLKAEQREQEDNLNSRLRG
jgi:flagellar export protein FliJ